MRRWLVDIAFGATCVCGDVALRLRAIRPTPPYRRPKFGREVNAQPGRIGIHQDLARSGRMSDNGPTPNSFARSRNAQC